MRWQEYQDAVGELYEQMNEFGIVKKNITIPDKVTGQARQVDVWWEMNLGSHTFKILIDAKKRKEKIDVKDVEEILMLSDAVNADKAIIVTNNEWTKPAETKANHVGLDLRILTIDEATDLVVPEKWQMCSECEEDCIVMDEDGITEYQGLYLWWIGGKCRSCNSLLINCQDCGLLGISNEKDLWKCYCGHTWKPENKGVSIKFKDSIDFKFVNTDRRINPRFIEKIMGFPDNWTKLDEVD